MCIQLCKKQVPRYARDDKRISLGMTKQIALGMTITPHRATLRNGVTLNTRAFSAISRVMKRSVIGVPS